MGGGELNPRVKRVFKQYLETRKDQFKIKFKISYYCWEIIQAVLEERIKC